MKRLLLDQAEANRYLNGLWMQSLLALPFEELDRPSGAFFGSIFGTLNHILLADRVWLSRIGVEPFKFDTLADRIAQDPEEFRAKRVHTDDVLIALVAGEHDFLKEIAYRTSAGEECGQPLYQVLLHVYAHQNHHRGQISQMCHEQAMEIPEGGLLGYFRQMGA